MALCMRWLWFNWSEQQHPWSGMEVPCNEVDKQFFRASTHVTLGDGNKASFWESTWLDGRAPRDIAPNLFKLARPKNRTVRQGLRNDSWTKGLWRMTTADEMADMVQLWNRIGQVQLTDQPDRIVWKWTPHGEYTAKSAYEAHFKAAYCTFNSKAIWQAKVEGKHRFFAWLLVQQKILTADKLIARNWPCEPLCSLLIRNLKLLNTCACIASLHAKSGSLYPPGPMGWYRHQYMELRWKTGGTLRYEGDHRRSAGRLPPCLSTQPGTYGRSVIAESSMASLQRRRGFST